MRQFYHQKGWSYPEDGTRRSSDVAVALSSAGEQPGYIRLVAMARLQTPATEHLTGRLSTLVLPFHCSFTLRCIPRLQAATRELGEEKARPSKVGTTSL